ncbi:EI24 domain-containing protein [Catenuloplanes indicus JCM 9534]|uniref:CysZ protein n=1 Tax=Catenuloplanes indicus TaxID=137267 RepID=A0AAE3W2I1_9ACTN|nr:CysZ protein [Catenuloplanes indicus]
MTLPQQPGPHARPPITAHPAAVRAGSTAQEFLAGIRMLLRGLGLYVSNPRLMAFGLIPAFISGLLYLAAFGTLFYFVSDISEWLTPFADTWDQGFQEIIRLAVAAAVLGLFVLVGMLTFTAITLLIGDPFYEKISEAVENRYGGVPDEVDLPWHRTMRLSLTDSIRLIGLTVLCGIPLFLLGFIPLIGQTVVPVIAALVGGWFLAIELTGFPFYRRGLRLADRRRVLRAHRPAALGFGVGVFICFLIPLGAILVTPAAVAGAALLSRRSLGFPIDHH